MRSVDIHVICRKCPLHPRYGHLFPIHVDYEGEEYTAEEIQALTTYFTHLHDRKEHSDGS